MLLGWRRRRNHLKTKKKIIAGLRRKSSEIFALKKLSWSVSVSPPEEEAASAASLLSFLSLLPPPPPHLTSPRLDSIPGSIYWYLCHHLGGSQKSGIYIFFDRIFTCTSRFPAYFFLEGGGGGKYKVCPPPLSPPRHTKVVWPFLGCMGLLAQVGFPNIKKKILYV